MGFDRAFDVLLKHEGGYVNDPRDPGGETRYGISKKSYPSEDIKNMTVERAKLIYKRDYWDLCKCDQLPQKLALHVFDFAVNSGNVRAIKFLQNVAGVSEDGKIGPKTIEACKKSYEPILIVGYCNARVDFMSTLKTWSIYKRGWVRRIMGNIKATGTDTEALRALYLYLEGIIK